MPMRLGQHAHLAADVAVADDAQRLAAHLVASSVAILRHLPWCTSLERSPSWRASMTISAIIISATLRVLLNGRVEHRHAALVGGGQLHLVGADAEAAQREQALGLGQRGGGHLRLAADAQHVHVGDALLQLGLGERTAQPARPGSAARRTARTALSWMFSSRRTLIFPLGKEVGCGEFWLVSDMDPMRGVRRMGTTFKT